MLGVNAANNGGWAAWLFARWLEGTDASLAAFSSSTSASVLAILGLTLTFSRYRDLSGWILVGTSLFSTLFAAAYIEPDRAGLALFFLGAPVAAAALMISSRAGIGTFLIALTGTVIIGVARRDLTLELVLPPAGSLVYLSALIIVATYVREKLERVHKAKLAESAKMASLGQMSAGIAHEINNPLFVLSVSASRLAELVAEESLDRHSLSDISRKVSDMVDRIDQIAKGLKNFARESATDPMHQVSVKDLLVATRDLCRHRFAQERVVLTFPEVPPTMVCECRPVQISQVLVNLLNNAVDAVASVPTKWVRIEVTESETHVKFAVVDSGPGVPAALRKRIMTPFFTTKGEGKGTGLGLSLSLAIARDHGGRLFLDETSNTTRFVLELPKHPAGTKVSFSPAKG